MVTKTELARLNQALNGILWAVEDERCEFACVIGFSRANPDDPLIVLQYPEDKREEFRQKLVALINARMGDS